MRIPVFAVLLSCETLGVRLSKDKDRFLSSHSAGSDPLFGSTTDGFGVDALKLKVDDICKSAVRRDEGTQCQYHDPGHNYTESAVYQLCLDDWYGVPHGMGSACWEKHGETTAASGCGRACLYKSLKTLVAKHGAVPELLKWGITDFNLWNQVVNLTKPSADGLTESELVSVFERCADGGDRAVIALPRIRHVFECVDSDRDERIDGAELTQPAGCFKPCLELKEPAGHVNSVPDDADVTDVLRMWLTGGENAPGSFQEMLGGDQDCIAGDLGPCEGCESYHEDFDPMAHRESNDEVQMWDEDGDLLDECDAFHHRCEHNPDDEECRDVLHNQYCDGVQTVEKEYVDRCLDYFQKCCPNAVAGDGDVLLEECQPIQDPTQKDWYSANAGHDQGGCYILDTKAEFAPDGSPQLNYPELSFCGGVFERARYDMIESAKMEGDTNAGTPDDISGGVTPGFLQFSASRRHYRSPTHKSKRRMLNSQQKEARNAPSRFTYQPYKQTRMSANPLSKAGMARTSKFRETFGRRRETQLPVRVRPPRSSRSGAYSRTLNPKVVSMIGKRMRKQDPPAPEVVPVGDEGVTNIDPSIVEPPTINAPPEPLHTSEEQPQAALSPESMNADQGVAAGAAPPSDVAAYDPTVYEDAIVEPKCPVERFMNMKNGEEEVVRNTEYYNMFCAWMHEVAKPAYAWDLGHFIDQATVSFANRQFEPDSTCQPEVKIEESTARPSRSDIHDDNLQNCQQAWEKCEASEGGATQCDFLTTPACHGFQPKGAEIMEPGLPHVPAPAKPEPAAVASQPAPPAPTKPEPAKGTIPAGTGTTAQVIPVGTGGDLPGGEPTPPKESAGSSPSLVAEEKAEIFPESADSIAEPVN